MPLMQLNDIAINYEIHGSGPRLLLLGGTAWDLRNPKSGFERGLHKHFQVLRYDQRGQGLSGKPDQPYSMADYANDAANMLAALGWNEAPVLVIGLSFGGMVAQELTLRYPALVQKLVLACTSSGGAGGASYPIHEIQHLPPQAYAERFLLLANRTRDAAWQAANPQIYAALLAEMKKSREGMDEAGWIGLQRQLQARIGHDTWQRLKLITCATLVCGGLYDDICPTANVEALASQIAGSQLQLFAGGHGFYMENPQVLPAVLAFLQDGEPAAT